MQCLSYRLNVWQIELNTTNFTIVAVAMAHRIPYRNTISNTAAISVGRGSYYSAKRGRRQDEMRGSLDHSFRINELFTRWPTPADNTHLKRGRISAIFVRPAARPSNSLPSTIQSLYLFPPLLLTSIDFTVFYYVLHRSPP